jgi:orotidine-5'-phosphate decarboxylase
MRAPAQSPANRIRNQHRETGAGQQVTPKNISDKDRLIFAMDVPDCDRARALAEELGDAVSFYKIGLELMMSGGYFDLLDWMLERDRKVFCDLKFFDIPATVGSAVRRLKDRGATFVTVHGNRSIMEAAAENKGGSLKVLGVTVLTSLDRGDLDDLGFDCDIGALVLSRAKQALEAGCDGVISSGLEVPKLREFVDEKLLVISPGIRPVDNKPVGDQKRVVTLETAFSSGADYIVVGRPIRDADSPRAAAEAMQASIAAQFES